MRVLERQRERLGATRHKHQVDVVRHGAVPHHRHSVQRKTLLQQIKMDAAICIAVENKPARISTLGHVVDPSTAITRGRRAMDPSGSRPFAASEL
jgi:hypothetical protein